MKKLFLLAVCSGMLGVAAPASAAVNPPISIAYPIEYSKNANYFKVSFTVTCGGGMNDVKWSFDGASVGSATFYDNFNTQFLHKLGTGWHVLEVNAHCPTGPVYEALKFYVT